MSYELYVSLCFALFMVIVYCGMRALARSIGKTIIALSKEMKGEKV